MFHVWVGPRNGTMKVASADTLQSAMMYAVQYREEGPVTVRDGNKIVALLSEVDRPSIWEQRLERTET